jgi:hypothetical protein
MKRWASVFAALILASAFPSAFAQDAKTNPLPSDILGPQLIAWSQFQKPQPVPQPLPPPDRDVPAQAQAQNSGQGQAPSDQQQPPSAQTFTGTIMKDGKDYVLKVSDGTVYQLDDQERAKQYAGKQVKIAGKLDAKGSSLHVTGIELVS